MPPVAHAVALIERLVEHRMGVRRFSRSTVSHA